MTAPSWPCMFGSSIRAKKNDSCGSSRMARAASTSGLSPSCHCMVRSDSPVSSPDAWWSSPKVRRPPTRSGGAISPRSAPSRAPLAAPQTMCSRRSTVSTSRCGQMPTRRAASTPRSCLMASCAPARGRPRASWRSILRPLGSQRRALTPTTGAPRTRSMTSLSRSSRMRPRQHSSRPRPRLPRSGS